MRNLPFRRLLLPRGQAFHPNLGLFTTAIFDTYAIFATDRQRSDFPSAHENPRYHTAIEFAPKALNISLMFPDAEDSLTTHIGF
jgi:hypothetical protein